MEKADEYNNDSIEKYILRSKILKNNGVTTINPLSLEQGRYVLRMSTENYKIKLKKLSEEYKCRF